MLNLDKVIYKRIEDGTYTIHIKDWSIKTIPATDDKPAQDYVALSTTVTELNDRPLEISLFEKGLDILTSNVINFFETEEMSIAEALAFLKNKTVPAQQTTKPNPNDPAKPYRNWVLCRKPSVLPVDSEDEGF